MSDDPKIKLLFEQRLNLFAEVEGLRVQWEGETFDPPQSEDPLERAYLMAFLLRAPTVSEDLAGAHTRYTGFFQVNVVTAAGIGTGQADAIAARLVDHFPINLPLSTPDGFKISIMSPLSIANGLQGSSTWTVPTSCRYRGDRL